ncbi:hypothetical protein O7A70_08470 [Mesorhizobium sp. Cs1299R1N1]
MARTAFGSKIRPTAFSAAHYIQRFNRSGATRLPSVSEWHKIS